MKNIIKIDFSTYLIVLLSFFAGNFKEIIILYLIIIIHEFGHVLFLKLYKKEITKINIYPFGGITKYNSLVNHNLLEELLISVGGIINQFLLFIIFFILKKHNIINNFTYNIFIKNNINLLIFNLIPIIGLDGEKIIHTLLEYILPYKMVNNICIILSIISLIIFIIKSFLLKINIVIVVSFLFYKLIFFIKNKKYIENKFLLERCIYNIPYKRIKYYNNYNSNKMYQETYHFFNNKNEYYYLNQKYKI